MNAGDLEWPYWSVDLPGLTEARAERLIAVAAAEGLSLGGSTVDPSFAFTTHLDHGSVRSAARGLEMALGSDGLAHDDRIAVQALFGSLADWLASAPEPGGEP